MATGQTSDGAKYQGNYMLPIIIQEVIAPLRVQKCCGHPISVSE